MNIKKNLIPLLKFQVETNDGLTRGGKGSKRNLKKIYIGQKRQFQMSDVLIFLSLAQVTASMTG